MVDRIFIENLRLKCRIGVTDDERREPQDVIIDVSLFRSLERAAITNSLDDTLNYREAMERISDFVTSGQFSRTATAAIKQSGSSTTEHCFLAVALIVAAAR